MPFINSSRSLIWSFVDFNLCDVSHIFNFRATDTTIWYSRVPNLFFVFLLLQEDLFLTLDFSCQFFMNSSLSGSCRGSFGTTTPSFCIAKMRRKYWVLILRSSVRKLQFSLAASCIYQRRSWSFSTRKRRRKCDQDKFWTRVFNFLSRVYFLYICHNNCVLRLLQISLSARFSRKGTTKFAYMQIKVPFVVILAFSHHSYL